MSVFFRFADTVGDGTGSTNAAVDGSSTAKDYMLRPLTGHYLKVARMIVSIEDAGTFDSASYGNGISMTNGISVGVFDAETDVLKQDLLGGEPVKTNADWVRHCHDLSLHNFGTGNPVATIRWTFEKSGDFIYLSNDEYLKISIRDNLTALVNHQFFLNGVAV